MTIHALSLKSRAYKATPGAVKYRYKLDTSGGVISGGSVPLMHHWLMKSNSSVIRLEEISVRLACLLASSYELLISSRRSLNVLKLLIS